MDSETNALRVMDYKSAGHREIGGEVGSASIETARVIRPILKMIPIGVSLRIRVLFEEITAAELFKKLLDYNAKKGRPRV
jgi:hypothetical protein